MSTIRFQNKSQNSQKRLKVTEEFQLVAEDFPTLPQVPFYCPYVDPETDEVQFKTRKEYADFCRKHNHKILDDKMLKEIGEQYRLAVAEEEQKQRDQFYCPYTNLDGERDEYGKLLPRFQTRAEYEAHCIEWAKITKSKVQILSDQQLRDLGKQWDQEKETRRLQAACRDYLDLLEQEWWETC